MERTSQLIRSVEGRNRFSPAVTVALLILMATLPGCTPEKARALRAAVEQFKVESLEAINRIEEMSKKEMSEPPASDETQTKEFVDSMLASKKDIDPDVVEAFLHPYAVDAPESTAARKRFVSKMRTHYSAFAAIFAELEQANFTGRKTVKDSADHAKILTAQMAGFAKKLAANPPVLLQWRNQLIDEMSKVKKDTTLGEGERRVRLAQLGERWLAVRQEEAELQRTTVEQCLKAATLGHEVQKLIAEYDHLSVSDLNSLTTIALRLAGEVSGKDLSTLSSKTEALFTLLKEDNDLGTAAQAALDEALKQDSPAKNASQPPETR